MKFILKLLLVAAMLSPVAHAGTDRYAPVPAKSEHLAVAYKLAKLVDAKIVILRNTRSMEPTLDAEDLLIMRKVPHEELRIGDIIGFVMVPHRPSFKPGIEEPLMIVHRIVKTRGSKLITRGDNRHKNDPGYAQQIQGRIEFVIDGQTGVIRDMRHSPNGKVIDLEEAIARLSGMNTNAAVAKTL